MRRMLLIVAAALAGGVWADSNVTETIPLTAGENWVYLEVTPTNGACSAFFADYPSVKSAMCYDARAYEQTAQYDSDGERINQKPVAFLVWRRGGDPETSTLNNLVGGMAYVINTDAPCTLHPTGRPQRPRLYWCEATAADETNLLNLVAASLPADATKVTFADYFGEGPAGYTPTVVEVGEGGRRVNPAGTAARKFLTPGRAYYMSAGHSTDWPGVIGISGAEDGLLFASNGASQVSFVLQNRGTTNHTFEVTYGPGQDGATPPTLYCEGPTGWTNLPERVRISIAPGNQETLTLSADRLSVKGTCGGILTISDPDASRMRVRLSVDVEPEAQGGTASRWPDGVYMGQFALTHVAYGTSAEPSLAGGKVEGTLIYVCAGNGTRCQLLQRLCMGVDAKGAAVFGQDLAKVRAKSKDASSVRRVSSVVLDPYQPKVDVTVSGGTGVVAWTVGKYAPTNPMRHSWHPDHDGLRSLPDGSVTLAPDGDDPAAYTESVKPEIFSIANEVVLTDLPKTDDAFRALDGTVTGTIVWRLKGLRSEVGGGDIVCTGTYSLSRVSAVTQVDD